MSDERVIPYADLGFKPSPSGSGETIMLKSDDALVGFLAMSSVVAGQVVDPGFVIVRCVGSMLVRHGYPNDEGTPEHPLYGRGLSSFSGVGEVLHSSWVEVLTDQRSRSAHRIFGPTNLGPQVDRWMETERLERPMRHFVFPFKETLLECLCRRLEVVGTYRRWREMMAEMVRLTTGGDG